MILVDGTVERLYILSTYEYAVTAVEQFGTANGTPVT